MPELKELTLNQLCPTLWIIFTLNAGEGVESRVPYGTM